MLSDLDPAASDGELARRIEAAEPARAREAEAELCRRFAPRIRAYGVRHLPVRDAAGDLVQRVLVRVLEKLRAGEVREPDRVASFVLGVARMQAREMRRRGGRERALDGPAVEALVSEASREPEPLASERLAGCLEALGERERTVVLLSFYADETANEIGATLDLSPGNVRVLRHRAIERLRRCMGIEVAA